MNDKTKDENAVVRDFTFPPEPAPDRWQRIHSRDELEAFYHHILPRIRAAAKECGYAIGVHGSMRRDLDLIAAPWVADHADRDALALAVSRAACGVGLDRFEWKEGEKPCGRVAVTLPICWCEWPDLSRDEKSTGCIDLSVMPDTRLSQDSPQDDPGATTHALVMAHMLLARIRDNTGTVPFYEANAVMGMIDAVLPKSLVAPNTSPAQRTPKP